jgi:hypothetical protein
MTTVGDNSFVAKTIPAPDKEVPDEFDLLCEHCGYSLVGLTTSNRCPECGEEFDPKELPLARVPWLFRKRHGKLRSYIQTVCLILQHPTGFAKELCRPVRVSAQDAKQFRRWTIRIAILTCIVGGIVIGLCGLLRNLSSIRTPLRSEEILVLILSCIMIPWSIVLLNVMFRLMTDLPTFIWRGLDGDPINLAPLHHYASAPLALAPMMLVPITIWAMIANRLLPFNGTLFVATNWMAVGLVAAFGLLLWIVPLAFMKTATGCSRWRVLGLALYLPFHWLLSFVLAAATFGATLEILGDLSQMK